MNKIINCLMAICTLFLTGCSFSLDPTQYWPEYQYPNSVWVCEELPITAYFPDASANSYYPNVMVYSGDETVCFSMETTGLGGVSAEFLKYKKTKIGFVEDTSQYLFGGEVIYKKDKFIIRDISYSDECFIGDCDMLTFVYKEDYSGTMKDVLMQYCYE